MRESEMFALSSAAYLLSEAICRVDSAEGALKGTGMWCEVAPVVKTARAMLDRTRNDVRRRRDEGMERIDATPRCWTCIHGHWVAGPEGIGPDMDCALNMDEDVAEDCPYYKRDPTAVREGDDGKDIRQ